MQQVDLVKRLLENLEEKLCALFALSVHQVSIARKLPQIFNFSSLHSQESVDCDLTFALKKMLVRGVHA